MGVNVESKHVAVLRVFFYIRLKRLTFVNSNSSKMWLFMVASVNLSLI